ncbi:uncharacterized protein DDB_G0271670-like [Cottoperca gobio]|uniref:Uncharacterized protein DDB_G0271670-like n=1 Tax=Cottoperca gobio TaxID=56716 RepID=A0A6J2RT78_COTGO|nr:uncharacterized protein DDB_G0271670-like [Cottoperca gobio]
MSVDSKNSCVLLSSRDSRTSCVFQNEDEKDDIPGVGEESVLEMLSYSKFSNLETWLCMPSSLLLPRALDSTRTSSSSSTSSHASNHSSNSQPISSSSSSPASVSRRSTCSDPGETAAPLRSSERDPPSLSPALGKEMPFLTTSPLPILSSTPAGGHCTPHSGVSIRKRRRLAASPGGLHWTSAGSVQRDFWSPDLSPVNTTAGGGARSLPLAEGGGAAWAGDRAALRKAVSVDDRLLQPHLRLLSRLERGRKKLRNKQLCSSLSSVEVQRAFDAHATQLVTHPVGEPTRCQSRRRALPASLICRLLARHMNAGFAVLINPRRSQQARHILMKERSSSDITERVLSRQHAARLDIHRNTIRLREEARRRDEGWIQRQVSGDEQLHASDLLMKFATIKLYL